jgi:hypothetical protein
MANSGTRAQGNHRFEIKYLQRVPVESAGA